MKEKLKFENSKLFSFQRKLKIHDKYLFLFLFSFLFLSEEILSVRISVNCHTIQREKRGERGERERERERETKQNLIQSNKIEVAKKLRDRRNNWSISL